jgi:dnd system-associated protein 4
MRKPESIIRSMYRSEEFEPYYQLLGNKPETKIFPSMKDAFMFALTLGFRLNKRMPLNKNHRDPIPPRIFNEEDMNIIELIAYTSQDDISILIAEETTIEKKCKIIEEFANYGMSIMIKKFCTPSFDETEYRKFIESFNTGDIGSFQTLSGLIEELVEHK